MMRGMQMLRLELSSPELPVLMITRAQQASEPKEDLKEEHEVLKLRAEQLTAVGAKSKYE